LTDGVNNLVTTSTRLNVHCREKFVYLLLSVVLNRQQTLFVFEPFCIAV